MRVLVTGRGGQLAWELERLTPQKVDLVSLDISELDITNSIAVNNAVRDIKPQYLINAAAYTAVDEAESKERIAYDVNSKGVEHLAQACKLAKIPLFHVSTDFIFDGKSSRPYQTESVANPVNVYGASKYAGECAVRRLLPESSVIVRTAWLYSSHGNNFVKTMLRLMSHRSDLEIVCDQIGSPTWAKGLAGWLWEMVSVGDVSGIYHWTDAGVASWYDFAVAIQELAIEKGLLSKEIALKPIPASSYPSPACRPSFTVLDKTATEKKSLLEIIHWRKQLSSMLDELC